MTNIYAAFETLEEQLMELDEEASITVVFISDGKDTVNGDEKVKRKMKDLRGGLGRDITLLCLGIQSGFPTAWEHRFAIRRQFRISEDGYDFLFHAAGDKCAVGLGRGVNRLVDQQSSAVQNRNNSE